jgi:hypothetical protein
LFDKGINKKLINNPKKSFFIKIFVIHLHQLIEYGMTTIPKLINTPIQLNGQKHPEYKLVEVTAKLDAMQEPNLVSVECYISKEDLLPKMDSVSKQRVLHNLFAQCQL